MRGATTLRENLPCYCKFQSTRPCGARQPSSERGAGHISVSIHAPMRGATANDSDFAISSCVSIHAPMRGATMSNEQKYIYGWFQSTRPCGARPSVAKDSCQNEDVSIHAPMRGATRTDRKGEGEAESFNPRAHAGRDSPGCLPESTGSRFNPRAHAGRDSAQIFLSLLLPVSIHAPMRGATINRHL